MTIDRLSSLSAQIAALRTKAAGKNGDIRRKRDTTGTKEIAGGHATKQHDVQALREQLVEIVRAASNDETAEAGVIRKRIVKAILLWEFGPELREYAEWQPMVDTIAESITSDQVFLMTFNRLLEELNA